MGALCIRLSRLLATKAPPFAVAVLVTQMGAPGALMLRAPPSVPLCVWVFVEVIREALICGEFIGGLVAVVESAV